VFICIKYTRRPDATAARDKDNGSVDDVGVREGRVIVDVQARGEMGNWKTFE